MDLGLFSLVDSFVYRTAYTFWYLSAISARILMDRNTILECAKRLCSGCRKNLPFIEKGHGCPARAKKMHIEDGYETFCESLELLELANDSEIILPNPTHPKEIHAKLAKQGIRIFKIDLGRDETFFWIHPHKTMHQWREDFTKFILKNGADHSNAWASSVLMNNLFTYLHNLGYIELDDVISDVFEGRIGSVESIILPDPKHEEDESGFGHYGWDNSSR
jgi:hypothetical protein